MGLSWRWSVRAVVFLASLLVLASAQEQQQQQPPPRGAAEMAADVGAILGRVRDPRGPSRAAAVPLSWCHELRVRRHRSGGGGGRHHRRPSPLPLPPPGREVEIDARYGVAKRLVPTGPNPLHN
ncbi:hypothetical protein ABZP36_029992 [Zizania latifolia]